MSFNERDSRTELDRRSALSALTVGSVATGAAMLFGASAVAADKNAGTVEKQKPKDGEPTAVGYPCIIRKRDIEAAKKAQIREESVGEGAAESITNRVLAGSALTYNSADGLYYWYSNYNSSDFCDTSYIWHSGYVYAYQFLGVCGVTGLNSFNIWVSDL